jgi:hypothetical protein
MTRRDHISNQHRHKRSAVHQFIDDIADVDEDEEEEDEDEDFGRTAKIYLRCLCS